MNQGNAGLGALWLVGAYLVFGWPVAALVGVILFGWLLEWSLARLWRNYAGRRGFAYQSPLEQALRRGSQGFALMVLAVLASVALHFWLHSLARLIPPSAQLWLLLICGALFVAGGVRFSEGVRNSAGARGEVKWSMAALRCVVGVALGYWVLRDLPALIGPPLREVLGAAGLPAGRAAPVLLDVIAAAVFVVSLWLALVGGVRLTLLSWPRRGAREQAERFIDEDGFSWEE